jgi:S-phase kinase-associated protein 1
MSKLISNTFEEDEDDEDITDKDFVLPKVSTDVLHKVVEFCTHYQTVEEMTEISTPLPGETMPEIVKQDWYCSFCNVERDFLFNMVAAANYLDIKPLLDLTCLAVAISIKGKGVDELKSIFKIPTTSEIVTTEKEETKMDQN